MKAMNETDEIKILVERFFDGTTSLDEENRLYAFFASDGVPPELEEYREMFCGFSLLASPQAVAAMGNTTACADKTTAGSADNIPAAALSYTEEPYLVPRRRLTLLRRVSVAAAAAVLIVAGFFVADDIRYRNRLSSLYGGSYMIVDGRRVDNLKEILPHIESTLRLAENMEKHAGGDATIRAAEQNVLDNISDPAERERIGRLLE